MSEISIKNRRASRVIFLEYIFSNLFTENEMDFLEGNLKIEEEEYAINESFLATLFESYQKNKDEIFQFLENYKRDNLDYFMQSVLIAGVTELFINDNKLVISEFLKISDYFELNSNYVHHVLDNISKLINQIKIKKEIYENIKTTQAIQENIEIPEENTLNSSENIEILEENILNSSENIEIPEENTLNSSENIEILEENTLNSLENIEILEENTLENKDSLNSLEDNTKIKVKRKSKTTLDSNIEPEIKVKRKAKIMAEIAV